MSLALLESPSQQSHRIIPAQDQDSWSEAQSRLTEYGSDIVIAKVGSLADNGGSDAAVGRQAHLGKLTMLDWKFNDIDDTMRRRTRNAALAGASIITVHASLPETALIKAVEGIDEALISRHDLERPWLVGVTVLTSIEEMECVSIFGDNRAAKVRQFSHLAAGVGLDGVVCSVFEAEDVKRNSATQNLKVIAGAIRPSYAIEADEQATVANPTQAIQAGVDLLVVGRPLIRAEQYGLTTRQALDHIADEIKAA